MSAYKIGKGRATRTVEARQYTRDQDWDLVNWINGPVQVHRDHFRIGPELTRAEKGDWLVKYPDKPEEIHVMKPHAWATASPRSTGEEI